MLLTVGCLKRADEWVKDKNTTSPFVVASFSCKINLKWHEILFRNVFGQMRANWSAAAVKRWRASGALVASVPFCVSILWRKCCFLSFRTLFLFYYFLFAIIRLKEVQNEIFPHKTRKGGEKRRSWGAKYAKFHCVFHTTKIAPNRVWQRCGRDVCWALLGRMGEGIAFSWRSGRKENRTNTVKNQKTIILAL